MRTYIELGRLEMVAGEDKVAAEAAYRSALVLCETVYGADSRESQGPAFSLANCLRSIDKKGERKPRPGPVRRVCGTRGIIYNSSPVCGTCSPLLCTPSALDTCDQYNSIVHGPLCPPTPPTPDEAKALYEKLYAAIQARNGQGEETAVHLGRYLADMAEEVRLGSRRGRLRGMSLRTHMFITGMRSHARAEVLGGGVSACNWALPSLCQ